MVISYKWLLEYLPENLPVDKLSDILTSIGLEVEGTELVESVKGGLEGLVIGEVLTCEKHANADKLKITTVNVGGNEPLHIVCGAPNVAAGQKVVVAPVGSTVHPSSGESFAIKKAKIRGELSQGMICAEDEIGLGDGHDGIMVLPEDATVGTLAKEYFNIPEPDTAIHIGLTPNRSDAMSHIGVAKDVVAYLSYHNKTKYEVKLPEVSLPAKSDVTNNVQVNVLDTEACPRYMGVTISDIKVGESPEWLKSHLQSIGLRPINNVVDITNYVLHEYGQPLHAFDLEKIKGNTINVKTLEKGTKFITLDEQEIKLEEQDLMICDEQDGMCIAGVYGGVGSGVTDATTSIFLESAYFNPMYVRRTSMKHGLRTDAATHFEKSVDVNNVPVALVRAAQLIAELAGGKISSDVTDIYEQEVQPAIVDVKYDFINRLSGKEYEKDSVKLLLTSLGFVIENESDEELKLTVPTNKADVLQPADIVEEVLRIDGLDNIPIPDQLNISLNTPMENDRAKREKLANILCGLGFQEIVTNSIVNSKYYAEQKGLVKMLNSLTSELDVMRGSMLESGLEVVQYNCNRKNTDLQLFEFGKVYGQNEQGYHEQNQLALFVTGNVRTAAWNQKTQKADTFYAKGIVNNLLDYVGISKVKVKQTDDTTEYTWKKKALCIITKVSDDKLKAFDVKQDVIFVTINWDTWVDALSGNKVKYKEVSKHPAVQRDLAIVLDKSITYSQVQEATDKLRIDALKGYKLFDVFEGEKLGANKKSYALNYMFQLENKTLTDKETDSIMNKLIKTYKNDLQAEIRE